MAAGIEGLYGVRGENQPFYTSGQHDVFKAAYDRFFEEIGMSAALGGYFKTFVPIARKPICDFFVRGFEYISINIEGAPNLALSPRPATDKSRSVLIFV